MFTGIIEEVGRVSRLRPSGAGAGAEIAIAADMVLEGTNVGDSIAVNGVCLTVRRLASHDHGFVADAMPETLRRSNLGSLVPGARVNLERALLPTTRLGGHIVSGHIDGEARVTSVVQEANAHVMTLTASPAILRFVVEKGSVALDGVSLTVAHVSGDNGFSVSIIPHTFAHTTLCERRAGDGVNVECDVIGKYVERLMALPGECGRDEDSSDGLTIGFLQENGF